AKKREQQALEEARQKAEAEREAKKLERERLDEEANRKALEELESKKREQQMLEEARQKAAAELEAKEREQQMLEEANHKALAVLEARKREQQMLEEARQKAEAELEAKKLEQQRLETKKPLEGQAAASKPKPEMPFQIIAKGVSEEDANSSYNLGLGYMDLGLLDDAAKEFSRAASDPKLRLESLMLLGICMRKLKNYTTAIQCFTEAIKSSAEKEKLTDLHYETGITFQVWGKLQEALDSFKLVIKYDKSFRDVETRVYELRKALRSAQGG
ncbi:MAG: hypothetical protein HY098_09195, partial [Nitrospinae bacterium]|nr:hypothetical protein [Nitrospinota bacterium]